MTGYERVVKAVRFQSPDRIPLMHVWFPAVFDRYGSRRMKELYRKYPSDIAQYEKQLFASLCPGLGDSTRYQKGVFVDEWGCKWEYAGLGVAGMLKEYPLSSWDKLSQLRIPDPFADDDQGLRDFIRENTGEKFILLTGGELFTRMWWSRGFSNLLLDIADEKEGVVILRDKIVDYTTKRLSRLLNYEVGGVWFPDDWGTQRQLMVRPSVWRKIFKPSYKKIIELVHSKGKMFFYHSCGNIMEIIPDFMEIGVDAIHLQLSCYDMKELSRICRGKVCIISDIDRQYTLPRGTVEEVEQYVIRTIRALAKKEGGLIARGFFDPNFPIENMEAMYRAFRECGRHPLVGVDAWQKTLGIREGRA